MASVRFTDAQTTDYALDLASRKWSWEHPEAAPLRLCYERLRLTQPFSKAIGYLPLRYPGGGLMSAAIVDRHDEHDRPAGIHRIFLKPRGDLYNGSRGARFSLGKIPNGRAVLFKPHRHLVMGESVEDTLVVRQHLLETGIDWGGWSMCGPLRPIPMPIGITDIVIVVPPDGEARAVALKDWLESIGRSACLMNLDGDR